MPELPDVEGFKRVLENKALHKTINEVVVSDARILGKLSGRTFRARLKGTKLVAARRHGKYLMADIERGGWLLLHFGMSGALHFVRASDEEPPFTRVRFDFASDGSLAYTNKRMLGHVGFIDDVDNFITQEKLGPDALDPQFDFLTFKKAMISARRSVKSVLMDQQIIAGIGNIFSDEILFQAGVDPAVRPNALSEAEFKRVFLEVRNVLTAAIAHGAGSEKFVERMPKGALLPERKKGGRCPRCRNPLKIFKLGGRTAYCCPKCQNC